MTLNHIKIIMSCNVYLSSCAVGAYVPNWLSLPRVAALKIDLVYLCQDGSREQVILDVRLVHGLLELFA